MIFMGKVGTRKRRKTSQYYFQLVSVDGTRKWKTGSGYRTKAEAQVATKQKTVLLSVKNGTFTVYDILMQQFFMRQVFQVHIFILCVRDVYIGLF